MFTQVERGDPVLHTWVIHFTLRRRDYTQISEIVRGITQTDKHTHGLIDYITDYTSLETRSPTFLSAYLGAQTEKIDPLLPHAA